MASAWSDKSTEQSTMAVKGVVQTRGDAMMKKLGSEDSTERLIDDIEPLNRGELTSLASEGWVFMDVTERVNRAGERFYRHRFRHASAPPRGVI
jgi:hypothetical protein